MLAFYLNFDVPNFYTNHLKSDFFNNKRRELQIFQFYINFVFIRIYTLL